MLKSLCAIERYKNGDLKVLKDERWLMHLALTHECNINLERIMSLEDAKENYILNYVERTLKALAGTALSDYQTYILEETLKWCEVAKCGMPHIRGKWTEKGFNLFVHNVGSAQIYSSVEAEKSDVLYEKAIILLFDLFGLRKDKYDRFYEEETYLDVMNQSIDYKRIILDYIKGDRIVDIGPGGGALMDLISDTFPDKKVIGVDISQNVIDSLKKRKQLENRPWDVLYGDALNLEQYIGKGCIDTIIFCSIIHELYSYIEFNGRKFNHDTIAFALKSAFEILPAGGRIIIRDGIMTEPVDMKRIIKFLSEDGMEFLDRYCRDFKGREIKYEVTGQNEVMMYVNDAMEFLYTYTWGEKSYVHEVNEQFGYFTPSQYKEFIATNLGSRAKIIELRHFLQEGYTIALSPKIEFYDEKRQPVRLPDSTCLIVIEKQ